VTYYRFKVRVRVGKARVRPGFVCKSWFGFELTWIKLNWKYGV